MTDKQSQTSSSSSGTDVEMKSERASDAPSEILETGSAPVQASHQPSGFVPADCRSNASQPEIPVQGVDSTSEKLELTVTPFTGGPFTVSVNKADSVDDLKKVVAKKFKVLKERICLLYRDRQLSEGTLNDNQVVNGSRITLLPRAETGLLAQRPEQSVMQALESLSDNQVVDFLSGKAPLNLTMRLGDHMMLIQLQLSTVNSASSIKRPRFSSTSTPSHSQPEVSSRSSFSAASQASQYRPKLDTRALAEASKNLTQTLKQLSSEVLTTRGEEVTKERPRKRPRPSTNVGGGAIIESMHHHGKGVYSGTFSGTLNPALQDRNGQPKRDITTIIHILNDLLCAQYKNYSATSQSRTARAASATTTPLSGTSSNSSPTNVSSGPHQTEAMPVNRPPLLINETLQQNTGDGGTAVDEHSVTRSKLEQLRKIMEERKARRKMRREARSSQYSTSWSVKSSDPANPADNSQDKLTENPVTTNPPAAANSSGPSAAQGSSASSEIFNPELEPVTA